MPPETLPQSWLSFLTDIDRNLKEETHFHCLGGFVITLVYQLVRSTADVDVVTIVPRAADLFTIAGEGSKLHKKYGVYLDSAAIATLHEDYEERLTEIFSGAFKHLRLLALDPYDIALAKLERNDQRDRDDVKYLAKKVGFDLELLEKRYRKELRPILDVLEREDLTLKLWIEMIEEERNAQGRKQ
jgi:hypothetical protein